MDPLSLIEEKKMPFAELLGIRILSAAPERLTAEMVVREDFCTVPAVLHGGAAMAFADSLGAYATMLNLPEGASTTTIESKTNFLAPAPAGTTVTAIAMNGFSQCLRSRRKSSANVRQMRTMLTMTTLASPPW